MKLYFFSKRMKKVAPLIILPQPLLHLLLFCLSFSCHQFRVVTFYLRLLLFLFAKKSLPIILLFYLLHKNQLVKSHNEKNITHIFLFFFFFCLNHHYLKFIILKLLCFELDWPIIKIKLPNTNFFFYPQDSKPNFCCISLL